MVEAINAVTEAAMSSPWAYLAIFVVSALDAFFPVVPSETLVITAGVLAASGKQTLLWVILAGAFGAFVGDHVSYLIGRFLGRPAMERLLRGERGHRARAWATRTLRRRGGLMIVVCRFIPGGRTATTVAAGTLSYPLARFSAFDALAASSWATYSGLIGYFAGHAFEGSPLLAVVVGVGTAVAISAVVEVARRLRSRRPGRGAEAGDEQFADSTSSTGHEPRT